MTSQLSACRAPPEREHDASEGAGRLLAVVVGAAFPARFDELPLMPARQLSLRWIVGAVIAFVAGLGLVVSAALVLMTSLLENTTASATSAMESVRLAREAEIDLLLIERVRDPIVHREVESHLRQRLSDAARFATAEEARLVAEATTRTDAYLRSFKLPTSERSALQQAAHGALDTLALANVARARLAQDEAKIWDRRADQLALAAGSCVLLVTGVLLVWIRSRAFAPILSLAAAMERFGNGDREARAQERGAVELKEMSRRFNMMASALAVQRQGQMAFLGGVAHDLRNPLSVLQMAVHRLGPQQPLPDENKLRQTIAQIERQITRMQRMLGDFLDMATIEAGELELQLAEHDARHAVRHVVELFEDGASQHPLQVSLPEAAVPVVCDQLRVEQVLTNLISNAMKYSPPGTVVEVLVELVRNEVLLSVTDHGQGISEADQKRLFEPFRRGHTSRTAPVPGVGLGLFVVKKIVEAHRGSIEVASTLGRGSTFRVRLPVVPNQTTT